MYTTQQVNVVVVKSKPQSVIKVYYMLSLVHWSLYHPPHMPGIWPIKCQDMCKVRCVNSQYLDIILQ